MEQKQNYSENRPKKETKKTIVEATLGVSIDERNGLIDNAYTNFMEKYGREPRIPKEKFKQMWADFEKLGLTVVRLQNANALPQLIDGKTTEKVLPITTDVAGTKIETEGKIALHNQDGEIDIKLYQVKKEPNLKEYFGHIFTDEERENILKTGSPGTEIYPSFDKEEGKVPVLITLDKDTNHFVAHRQEHIKIPDVFFKAKLSDEQKWHLFKGKVVRVEGMESTKKPGVTFSANVQYNAQKRGLELLFEQNQEKKLFPPKKISNTDINEQQQDTLRLGKSIFVQNLVDKQGRKYDAYVTWNKSDGKLKFSSKDPNDDTVKKIVTPEHKVQVTANNEGYKPEALKNVRGAVEKKQPSTPTAKQVAKQEQDAPPKKQAKVKV
jgi:hypothetical protein